MCWWRAYARRWRRWGSSTLPVGSPLQPAGAAAGASDLGAAPMGATSEAASQCPAHAAASRHLPLLSPFLPPHPPTPRPPAVVSELQSKLAWYAENQELVDQNRGLVQEQAALIQRLERRLEAVGKAPGAPKVRRCRCLQAQPRARHLATARLPRAFHRGVVLVSVASEAGVASGCRALLPRAAQERIARLTARSATQAAAQRRELSARHAPVPRRRRRSGCASSSSRWRSCSARWQPATPTRWPRWCTPPSPRPARAAWRAACRCGWSSCRRTCTAR
jgi:hypothetical protein